MEMKTRFGNAWNAADSGRRLCSAQQHKRIGAGKISASQHAPSRGVVAVAIFPTPTIEQPVLFRSRVGSGPSRPALRPATATWTAGCHLRPHPGRRVRRRCIRAVFSANGRPRGTASRRFGPDTSGTTNLSWTQLTSGANASGTLTVSSGAAVETLTLLGQYTAANFSATSDGAGGTLITDPPASSSAIQMPLAAQH
jgi:hypothetical protein